MSFSIKKAVKGLTKAHKSAAQGKYKQSLIEFHNAQPGRGSKYDLMGKYGGVEADGSKTQYGDMLVEVTRQQQQFYDEVYRPLNQRLIKDVNSTEIVDQAKADNAAIDVGKYNARAMRQQLRLGLAATPEQQKEVDYQQKLGASLTADGNINTARVQQVERNEQLRNELVSVSRGIATQAMDGITTAAGNEGNRNATNANIRAQNTAAEKQTYATVGSMALMVLMMM